MITVHYTSPEDTRVCLHVSAELLTVVIQALISAKCIITEVRS